MKVLVSFFAVLVLALVAYAGVEAANLQYLFGVIIPYAAFVTFLAGVVFRILKWGSSPVPFRIPTTCGQQKTLPWIKSSKLENPSGLLGVIARMALEVLFFRSLFRNLRTQLSDGPRLAYGEAKWLWLAGLAFHWSFLIILLRHLRFFMEKVPLPITMIEALFIRRVGIPQLRYISLINDYFPLFLILGIAVTGVLMRYFFKVDVVGAKMLAMSLISLKPALPEVQIGALFYTHLFLLSVLFAYFPFSKLTHMAGVFLSPTRNMANNSRAKRHVNPWNYPVHVHTYQEYEDDFREKMKGAGLPVEKE